MSFYGSSIVRYVTNMFKKIRVGTEFIEAKNQEDTINLNGELPITIGIDKNNNLIEIAHTTPQVEIVNPAVIQDDQSVTITLPEFDEYGHYSGKNSTTIKVGSNNIRADYTEETGDLKLFF